MKIAVIGAGYVGLVSAACFSDFGFEVACVDREARKIAALANGGLPIHEPGLDRMVADNREAGRLKFTSDLAPAVGQADVIFIAVGTPSRRGEDAADLSFVFAAGEEIAAALTGFAVIVTKSTVPVGTADRLHALIARARPGADFEVAANPEFLREGSAVEDFMRPDRIVIGLNAPRAEKRLRQIYRPLTMQGIPIVFTTTVAAEVIKYAANTFLATRIAFVNQLADFCEEVGADIKDVTHGMGLDRRIGLQYLSPGPGFGGSCFPKDTRALTVMARERRHPFTIVEEVIAANERRKKALAGRIAAAMGGKLEGLRIGVLGVSFKADTDDIREAAALTVIPELQRQGAAVAAYDPAAMDNGRAALRDIAWCHDAYSAAAGADALVALTEWNEFRGLDLRRLAGAMRRPVLIDFRNLFSLSDAARAGFEYHSVGRATVERAAPARAAAG
jgi:UDPglucose 6-dehydrogenase